MRNSHYSILRTMVFAAFPVFLVFVFIFNLYMVNECKKEGYSTFACMSMMQNGAYLIVREEKGPSNVDPR